MKKPQFGPYVYKVTYAENEEVKPTSCRHWVWEKCVRADVPPKWVHIASFMSWLEAREYMREKRAASDEIVAQIELYNLIQWANTRPRA